MATKLYVLHPFNHFRWPYDHADQALRIITVMNNEVNHCGDAFPIEGVLVATYLLSVEALPHCRCGVANKNRIV